MKNIKLYIVSAIALLLSLFSNAQLIHGGYDCATATVICSSVSFTDTIKEDTIGEVFDFAQNETSCWGTRAEFHPLWYQFNIEKSGSLELQITPSGTGFFNDWDFFIIRYY